MEYYPEYGQEPENDIYKNNRPGDDNYQNPSTENPGFSTIKKEESTYGVPTSERNMANDINIKGYYPYEKSREIPEIKLKDENYFKFNTEIKEISSYLETLEEIKEFDDSIFNKCVEHKQIYTDFCNNCNKNLCQNCKNNCLQNHHVIINLEGMKTEIKNKKNFLIKMLIKGQNKEAPKEKSQYIYNLTKSQFIENMDDDFPHIKCDIPNNIELLIDRIIGKDYINYFHYKNIIDCYNYIKNKYAECFGKDCLLIYYDIERWQVQRDQLNEEEEEDDDEENEEEDDDDNRKKIQIFGNDFVTRYRDRLFLIINKKKSELKSKIKVDDDYLEVILVKNSDNYIIKDLSCMFEKCKYLLGFKKFNDHNFIRFESVEDISCMFKGCSETKELDLEFLHLLKNIKNMKNLFCGCKELVKIENITDWNTSQVTNMEGIFNGCQQLTNMNFIKDFKTNNVTNFKEMFSNCKALKIIPEIENWIMDKAKNLEGMFKECNKLIGLPDISNWRLNNVESMSQMFFGCDKLEWSPDFSKVNFEHLENINEMFRGCSSLRKRPKYKKWKIKNKGNLSDENIFLGCKK